MAGTGGNARSALPKSVFFRFMPGIIGSNLTCLQRRSILAIVGVKENDHECRY
ncbi:MAG: hypothetical protein ACRYHA_28060 [Janthinobacterium lividum]